MEFSQISRSTPIPSNCRSGRGAFLAILVIKLIVRKLSIDSVYNRLSFQIHDSLKFSASRNGFEFISQKFSASGSNLSIFGASFPNFYLPLHTDFIFDFSRRSRLTLIPSNHRSGRGAFLAILVIKLIVRKISIGFVYNRLSFQIHDFLVPFAAQNVTDFIAEQVKRCYRDKNRGARRENYPRRSLEH